MYIYIYMCVCDMYYSSSYTFMHVRSPKAMCPLQTARVRKANPSGCRKEGCRFGLQMVQRCVNASQRLLATSRLYTVDQQSIP